MRTPRGFASHYPRPQWQVNELLSVRTELVDRLANDPDKYQSALLIFSSFQTGYEVARRLRGRIVPIYCDEHRRHKRIADRRATRGYSVNQVSKAGDLFSNTCLMLLL